MKFDPRKFPRTSHYLAQLPEGLASYPQCLAKGSVLRGIVETAPIALAPNDLPPELRALLAEPPLPTDWMSEVSLLVLGHAYRDRLTSKAWEDWTYERNRTLAGKSLYRVLFHVVSPERLFAGFPQRWPAFRRGSEMRVLEISDRRALLQLLSPPHLHDDHSMATMAAVLRALGDTAGARNMAARVASLTDVEARLELTWD